MKKIILLGITLTILAVTAGIVMASNGNGKEMARVMADTTGIIDKLSFRMRGCEIVHELSDATALKCPANIVSKLKVREDSVLHIMDMEANVQINADDVWALGYTGTGVTVAVLDTGVDTDHRELFDSIAGGQGFGYATYEDDNGHGTHVSGIITANGVDAKAKGVAPDAGVWMAKVCNAQGSCYTSDIAAAIEYVVKGPDGIIGNGDEPAKIISISLGGGGTSRANCDTDYLAQKVNWAVDNGVTVAAAAGNTSGRVSSPACASKAIAVGAVNKTDVRASWSGTGLALDIMAPGVSIYSSIIDGYASWSGTSMATPHISATVALLRQVNSALTDAQIKDALYKTAKNLGATGWDSYYGWGRVDALVAVNYVKPLEPDTDGDGVPDSKDACPSIAGTDCNGCSNLCSGCAIMSCNVGTLTPPTCVAGTCQNAVCPANGCGVGTCASNEYGTYTSVSNTCDIAGNVGTCTNNPCTLTCAYDQKCETPPAVKCWSGINKYLYRAVTQAKKFCKCASGIYGYKSYTSKILKATVYKYVDTGNNGIWNVTPISSNLPISQVTCTDGKAYPTNQDYYYPK
ncbi:MAG: S8 family serine peptidase [Candidatus Nealsonbacteria bacterium]|nr:S8 family serine peptidase [Candidatus Nealsonbacteria bacterium]